METTVNITAHKYTSPEITKLITALVAFQEKLKGIVIDKDQTKKFQDKKGNWHERKYAGLDNILKLTRPLLVECGLVVTQGLAGDLIDTCIYHKSGEFMGYLSQFQEMSGKGTTHLQNIGGGMTYLKRYTYNALLGICCEDDTDGNQEAKAPTLDDAKKILYAQGYTVEPKKLEFEEKNLEGAAEELLKYGTLVRVKTKYHLDDNLIVKIYSLAEQLKEKAEAQAETIE